MNIANTVISQDNSSLASMGTDQLLDLFTLDSVPASRQTQGGAAGPAKPGTSTGQAKPGKETMSTILESMDTLWDQSQYDDEYDLNSFMKTLKK